MRYFLVDQIVEMSAALKRVNPCGSKCRHKDSRIANRQTTRIETGVLEFLDAGSIPAISVKIYDAKKCSIKYISVSMAKIYLIYFQEKIYLKIGSILRITKLPQGWLDDK